MQADKHATRAHRGLTDCFGKIWYLQGEARLPGVSKLEKEGPFRKCIVGPLARAGYNHSRQLSY